jgi:hypothetical protein
MNMKRKAYVAASAVLGATVFFSAGLVAQDALTQPEQPEMSPEELAMMEAWAKYATPGEQHEFLAAKAGEWTILGKMWMDPNAPPTEFEGKGHTKSIMGGRYLIEKIKGDYMGEPFEGMGISGFDNLTQTFVGAWIDNMGTGILRSVGTPSGDGKTIHYTMDHPDLMKGKYVTTRGIERMMGPDEFVFSAFNTGPDGQEYKHMELTYKRNK